MRRLLLVSFFITQLSCRFQARTFHQPLVRLQSGDSIVLVATGPIFTPDGDTGLMYEYNPFGTSIDDTLALRDLAFKVWPTAKHLADSLGRRGVVLRATNRVSEYPAPEPKVIWNYGVVFEKRTNGRWYLLNDSIPVPDPERQPPN